MQDHQLTIHPPDYHTDDCGKFTATAKVEGLPTGPFTLELEATGDPQPGAPATDDWLLRSLLFPAMEFAQGLHIHGRIASDLIVSMTELNVIWNTWRPERYQRISISADEIVDPADVIRNTALPHLFAYSGGVDAMATLIRHHSTDLGWRKRSIGAALVVHGFDIPLDDDKTFDIARHSAEAALAHLGVPMVCLRSNLRKLPLDWENACGLSLAAVASCLGHGYGGLVFSSSSQDYVKPYYPWGTNVIVDPNYASSGFACFTDGAEMSRADKVAQIAKFPEMARHVRVCWQPEGEGGNCRKCEKCLRTILTFLAQGLEVPESLQPAGSLAELLPKIRIRGDAQDYAMCNVILLAEKHQIRDPWVRQVRKIIARERKRRKPRLSKRLRQFIRNHFKPS